MTDGGITRPPLALLTWDDLRSRGLEDQADDYARRPSGTTFARFAAAWAP